MGLGCEAAPGRSEVAVLYQHCPGLARCHALALLVVVEGSLQVVLFLLGWLDVVRTSEILVVQRPWEPPSKVFFSQSGLAPLGTPLTGQRVAAP